MGIQIERLAKVKADLAEAQKRLADLQSERDQLVASGGDKKRRKDLRELVADARDDITELEAAARSLQGPVREEREREAYAAVCARWRAADGVRKVYIPEAERFDATLAALIESHATLARQESEIRTLTGRDGAVRESFADIIMGQLVKAGVLGIEHMPRGYMCELMPSEAIGTARRSAVQFINGIADNMPLSPAQQRAEIERQRARREAWQRAQDEAGERAMHALRTPAPPPAPIGFGPAPVVSSGLGAELDQIGQAALVGEGRWG